MICKRGWILTEVGGALSPFFVLVRDEDIKSTSKLPAKVTEFLNDASTITRKVRNVVTFIVSFKSTEFFGEVNADGKIKIHGKKTIAYSGMTYDATNNILKASIDLPVAYLDLDHTIAQAFNTEFTFSGDVTIGKQLNMYTKPIVSLQLVVSGTVNKIEIKFLLGTIVLPTDKSTISLTTNFTVDGWSTL